MLTDQWNEAPLGVGVDPLLPRAVSATLAIIIARLDLLDRAARDAIDPRLLWCPENAVIDEAAEDVQLAAWSDDHAAKRAKEEGRRLDQRLRSHGAKGKPTSRKGRST